MPHSIMPHSINALSCLKRLIVPALAWLMLSGASVAEAQSNQTPSIQDKVNQKVRSGKAEFETTCAICHGSDAKGHGPFSLFMTKRVPDLTQLAKSNNGDFPFIRIYEMMNGPGQIPGHDIREMPIWSDYYKDRAPKDLGPFYNYSDVLAYVNNKTMALLAYVATLQEK